MKNQKDKYNYGKGLKYLSQHGRNLKILSRISESLCVLNRSHFKRILKSRLEDYLLAEIIIKEDFVKKKFAFITFFLGNL